MRRLKFLNSVIVIAIMACISMGCNVENNNVVVDKEGTSIGYTVAFSDIIQKNLNWKNKKIVLKIIDIRYMDNFSLEEKIDNSIEEAITSWITGKALNATSANIEIYCHSSKYLSFNNCLGYGTTRVDYINDYITIDMETGDRIMLDDLIEINEDFVEYIQKHDLVKGAINEERYYGDSEMLKKYTVVELLEKLKDCSMDQQQIVEKKKYPLEKTIEALVINRSSFFLKENQLVIVLGHLGGEQHFTFDFDDIEKFLKVEM